MPVIRTSSLSKTYNPGLGRSRVEALSGLTMQVEEREIFGFLGPNGAGKTTTMKILMGLIYATGGEASIFDQPLHSKEAKRRLGFLPEQPYFYDQLTAFELLEYFAKLFGIAAAERTKRARTLLERVGLGADGDRPIRGYSKGMLQRVGIAQALINDPELVILDEPMSGLDPIGRKEVRDLILELRAEKRTIFFSTHILSDVEAVCDRVVILHKGKEVAQAPLAELIRLAGSEMELVLGGATDAARAAVSAIPGASVAPSADRLVVRVGEDQASRALEAAKAAGASVLSLAPARKTLEEIFLDRIKGS